MSKLLAVVVLGTIFAVAGCSSEGCSDADGEGCAQPGGVGGTGGTDGGAGTGGTGGSGGAGGTGGTGGSGGGGDSDYLVTCYTGCAVFSSCFESPTLDYETCIDLCDREVLSLETAECFEGMECTIEDLLRCVPQDPVEPSEACIEACDRVYDSCELQVLFPGTGWLSKFTCLNVCTTEWTDDQIACLADVTCDEEAIGACLADWEP